MSDYPDDITNVPYDDLPEDFKAFLVKAWDMATDLMKLHPMMSRDTAMEQVRLTIVEMNEATEDAINSMNNGAGFDGE